MKQDYVPTKILFFSFLEKMMTQEQNNPKLFCELFQQKKIIIGLIKDKKIDSKRYKSIITKAYKDQAGEVKKCAENDLLALTNLNGDDAVQVWFKNILTSAIQSHAGQDALYKKYTNVSPEKKNIQPQKEAHQEKILPQKQIIQPKVEPQKQIIQPKVPPQNNQMPVNQASKNSKLAQVTSLRAIDDLLDSTEDKPMYEALLNKKQAILNKISTKIITASKYRALIQASVKTIKDEDVLFSINMEIEAIEDMHDGNIEEWFAGVVKESKGKVNDQKKNYNKIGLPKKSSPEKHQKKKDSAKQSHKPKHIFDINQLVSFKVLDSALEKYSEEKEKYNLILQKKKKLLELKKGGNLTGQKYKKLLEKGMNDIENEQIKQDIEFELIEIEDFHNGNVNAWFNDVISNAQMFLEEQETTNKNLQKGIIKKKEVIEDDDDDLKIDDDDQIHLSSEEEEAPPPKKQIKSKENIQVKENKKQPAHQNQKQPQNKQLSNTNQKETAKQLFDMNQMNSLKVIDWFLEKYHENKQLYCLLFDKKMKIIELMKTQKLKAAQYKKLQQTMAAQTKNQEIKEMVEMDLFDLQELNDGNETEWFQNLATVSAEAFQEQQAQYNKYQGIQGQPEHHSQEKHSHSDEKKPSKSKAKSIEKPIMAEVICFSALQKLLIISLEEGDENYFKELVVKRQKLMTLVKLNQLTHEKYRTFLKKHLESSENQFLKEQIAQEEALIETKFQGNLENWFKDISSLLIKEPPTKNQANLKQNKEVKESKTNPRKKVQFLLKKMAQFESILFYCKNHKIEHQNKYIEIYEKKIKKEALSKIKQLQENQDLDVDEICKKLFPEISDEFIYGCSKAQLDQKLQNYEKLMMKEISEIKKFLQGIKKSCNTENFSSSAKQITRCEENIGYLRTFKKGGLLAAQPHVEEEKRVRNHMDNNKLQNNEMEIIVNKITEIEDDLLLKVYLVEMNNERYQVKVTRNAENNARFIVKLPEKQFSQIIKGNMKQFLSFKFFKKGFFGGLTLISECFVDAHFIRSNIVDASIDADKMTISYTLKIQKAIKPASTELTHYELKIYPPYKFDPFVEKELMKKYLPFEKPTQSEIRS